MRDMRALNARVIWLRTESRFSVAFLSQMPGLSNDRIDFAPRCCETAGDFTERR